MQIETPNIKSKRGVVRPGPGRPVGYMAPATVRKVAIKTLQDIMQDETAPPEARAMSAIKLIEINEARAQ